MQSVPPSDTTLPVHPLVDIGANLANSAFAADLDAVIARAGAARVDRIVVTGSSVTSSRDALAIVKRRNDRMWSTAGIHPHHASDCTDEAIVALRECLADPSCVAVGECGLDYDRDYSPRPDQRRAFEQQARLAIELKRPIFLHERAAHTDFAAMLGEVHRELPRFVVHCFTGTEAELDAYIELGAYIGITGWICDERRGLHLRGIVGKIPPDRLMIETDAPYLMPRDIRPLPKHRRNEPALLPYVARAIASATGRSFEAVAQQSSAAAEAFFGLPARATS